MRSYVGINIMFEKSVKGFLLDDNGKGFWLRQHLFKSYSSRLDHSNTAKMNKYATPIETSLQE